MQRARIAVLRDVWFDRVWRANACLLVQERSDFGALWVPRNAPAKIPVDGSGPEVRIPGGDWTLADRPVRGSALALVRPGARWSLWHFWGGRRVPLLVRQLRAQRPAHIAWFRHCRREARPDRSPRRPHRLEGRGRTRAGRRARTRRRGRGQGNGGAGSRRPALADWLGGLPPRCGMGATSAPTRVGRAQSMSPLRRPIATA